MFLGQTDTTCETNDHLFGGAWLVSNVKLFFIQFLIFIFKVCNKIVDCDYKEDERHCLTLFSTDSIWLGKDGRPHKQNSGLLAVNIHGQWIPVCTRTWNRELTDKICRYMNWRKGISHKPVSISSKPFLIDRVLKTQHLDGPPVFPREVTKRSIRSSGCTFTELECSKAPACGVMPYYSDMQAKTPLVGPGVFPWHITLYLNGFITCGATLIHKFWMITHTDCASKFDLRSGSIGVARAGGFRDILTDSAHDQYKKIVHVTALPGTNVAMIRIETAFELNEHVNPVCIPNDFWTQRGGPCFLTGAFEENLKHFYQLRYNGLCDFHNIEKFHLCVNKVSILFKLAKQDI